MKFEKVVPDLRLEPVGPSDPHGSMDLRPVPALAPVLPPVMPDIQLTAPLPAAAAAPSRGVSRAYVAGWSLLGLGASAYLAVALTNPSALPDFSQTAVRSGVAVAADPIADAPGEAQSLRETVVRLQSEVSRLTANVIASEERAAQLAQKLATLDGSAAGASPVKTATVPPSSAADAAAIAGKFADAQPATKAAVKTVDVKATDVKTGAAAPAKAAGAAVATARAEIAAAEAPAHDAPASPNAGVKLINAQTAQGQPAQIETGSIAPQSAATAGKPAAPTTTAAAVAPGAATSAAAPAAPISFGEAVVKPAPRQIGLQIGTGTSVDDLRQTWNELSVLHSDSLKSLQPRYVGKTASADATAAEQYDLVAGPFRSAAQAARTCRTLQARGVACRVADFDGNAM